MTLDPEVARLLPALESGFPQVESLTGAQARAVIRARFRQSAGPEPVGRVEDRVVPGPVADIAVRIYWPADTFDAPTPIMIFAHGGGFVFCDLDTHDDFCRRMSNGVGALVISVDYRLAPESPWPAAPEDVYAATLWAFEHADELGADPACLVVAGDSAGGNLAAVTAVLARDRGGPVIAGQVLLYPVIAARFDTHSYARFATGFYNTRAAMAWYWDQYLPTHADREHPYASPIRSELHGLPPAIIVTAGYDPLHSEGESYANAVAAAGVPVTHRCYGGAIHGFMTMNTLALARQAQQQAWSDISRLLARDHRAPVTPQ